MKLILLVLFTVLIGPNRARANGKVNYDMDEDNKQIFNIWHKPEIKPRRYDLTDLGHDHPWLHGWFDVQGQGAANDYCRFVGNKPDAFLSCALAGTHGESEFNFNSQKKGFDTGYEGTGFMRDMDGDGRDDYCRCVGGGKTERISCTKAGPKGFYGSSEQPGRQNSFIPKGLTTCHNKKVRPEFG